MGTPDFAQSFSFDVCTLINPSFPGSLASRECEGAFCPSDDEASEETARKRKEGYCEELPTARGNERVYYGY
jgi:hypothetical protein